ncbi:MFS transporter [Candidatus Bathyarchaeota archaeon]|nr:MAG: MFS transporter [Candidatus Bathyarchaeota archaeon]
MKANTKSFRNVFALGFVSFFTDVSSEMVFSLLPTFIIRLPGSGSAVLGLIEGVAEFLSYGMRVVSGIFSDRFRKRKLLVLVGYSLSNIVKPLFAVAQTAFEALAIRVTDRIGKGVRTSPRDALLSESVPEERRGIAFGLHRTLDQTGAILGPLIASLGLYALGLTVRDIFWISLIPGTAALVVLLVFVEERLGKSSNGFRLLTDVHEILKGRFLSLLLVVGIFSLGAFNFSFVLLNASQAGIEERIIPIVYALINLTHTIIAIPSGALSDKIGKEKVLLIGYVMFLAAAVSLYLFPSNYLFAFLIALIFGVYDGIVNTVARALVPKYAENSLRGTAYGLYYLVVGSCFLVANVVVGTLWQTFGPSSAAVYSITFSSTAILGMLMFIIRQKRL